MILLPVLSLILPGIAAFALTRITRRVWPGLGLAGLALLGGLWLLAQASGAAHDSGEAVNRVLAAFGLCVPAVVSALSGTFFGRR